VTTASEKINEIKRLLKTALKEHQQLRDRHRRLSEQHEQVLVEKHSLEKEISDLKEQVKTIKLAQAIKGGDDHSSRDLKIQINRYLREVDRCLDLIQRD
jgi:predicted  nucleic acid-binding Zn-ribbon protein